MAEGRKLPAVFDHYIVPDTTGQFMAIHFVFLTVNLHNSIFTYICLKGLKST